VPPLAAILPPVLAKLGLYQVRSQSEGRDPSERVSGRRAGNAWTEP
jgi:hypothetical protein